ncbi:MULTISPECIES: DUF4345 family protein [Rhodococcus]|uniref:DUF4345 domain-containing protein n=2 Tax=Rhodococcus TaxID=1827 RepID=A0A3S3CNR5_9NOCA|nr:MULTISPECIES: DUF4345 family protein [Rhodococcus]RVW01983.1 DUF4345 domain-containing protein [Rhodococcus xishaensis]RVW02420.1 DUF4345 domain-containing protein [Rhodococcus spongiicola]
MELAMRIIVGLLAVPLVALGLRSMFMPTNMGEAVGLSPVGIPGLSEIRSVLGGFFLACVTMLVVGLAADETLWFLAVAILMGAAAIGRIVGIVADGFDKAVLPPLLIELVIGALLVAAHFVLN